MGWGGGGAMGNQSQKYLKNPPKNHRSEKRFNFNTAKRVKRGKTLAKGSLSFYNTKCLEPAADELVTILGNLSSYSAGYKGVAKAITAPNSKAWGKSNHRHLIRHCAIDDAQATRSVINALKSF